MLCGNNIKIKVGIKDTVDYTDFMEKQKSQKYLTILNKMKEGHDREKTSLFLSKRLYNEFAHHCDGVSPSKVIEALMADFIANTPKPKGDRPGKGPKG